MKSKSSRDTEEERRDSLDDTEKDNTGQKNLSSRATYIGSPFTINHKYWFGTLYIGSNAYTTQIGLLTWSNWKTWVYTLF